MDECKSMSNPLSPKERVKIPRQPMPEQEPRVCAQSFQEVNLGLDVIVAQREAQRCLGCADPKCVQGCPVGVQVRDFVELVLQGEYLKAAAKIREDNIMPAVTGRVCAQENQCEGAACSPDDSVRWRSATWNGWSRITNAKLDKWACPNVPPRPGKGWPSSAVDRPD